MVSQVTLGTFFNTNGKTVLGGAGGSGLDTQSLIAALVQAKSQPATNDKDKITLNDKQSSALSTFQTLLSTFQSAADALRNPPGVGNAANNAFKYTTAAINNAGTGFLTVTTTPGAALQSYAINNITNIATAATQSTGTLTSLGGADVTGVVVDPMSPAAGKFTAGTVTLHGQAITLTTTDTLNSIAAKFNAVSDTSGVNATVIKISDTTFKLVFTSTATGTDANFDLKDVGVDPANTVFGNVSLANVTAGTNAQFKLNGVSITRQTNNINDVISGLTFNLLDTTSSDDTESGITVGIKPDTVLAQNAINNFVKDYNAIKTFAAQQTQLKSDGTYADTALLANNPTFLNTINSLTTEITKQVAGLSGIKSLADIGITFTTQPASDTLPAVSNVLTVDDSALTSVLSTNFTDVSKLFGFNLSSSNPNIRVFSENNSLGVSSFSLHVDPGTSTFEATYGLGDGHGPVTKNLTASLLPGGTSYTLTGQSGTALAGLVLIYASTAASTTTVTTTQGIADRNYNTSFAALKPNSGTLAVALKSLADSDTQLNKDIDQVNLQVSQFQDQLLTKFGALEQAISKVNTLLQGLAAQQNAALAASGN